MSGAAGRRRELVVQVRVRPDTLRRDPAPREERQKQIRGVVREAAPIRIPGRLEPIVSRRPGVFRCRRDRLGGPVSLKSIGLRRSLHRRQPRCRLERTSLSTSLSDYADHG